MENLHEKTHIDLFSGIGGFAIAAGWAGFRTVCFCEIDPFCQEVLAARFGAVADAASTRCKTRTGNGMGSRSAWAIRAVGPCGPILIPDIRTIDGSRFRGTTLLTGGFPCQPFSVAGKRKGKADDRHLWPEMLRVIAEARPAWVVGENVAGIVNMELEQVCADLEGEGYEVQPVIIPACAVNAPHRRDRVWILGRRKDTDDPEGGRRGIRHPQHKRSGKGKVNTSTNADRHAPDAEKTELYRSQRTRSGREGLTDDSWDTPWPEVAARLCRVDDGLPAWIHRRRTERLKALGNSIVSQVAYEIIRLIP
jgi:DNA (cytosine-5)-methyltransferase 1